MSKPIEEMNDAEFASYMDNATSTDEVVEDTALEVENLDGPADVVSEEDVVVTNDNEEVTPDEGEEDVTVDNAEASDDLEYPNPDSDDIAEVEEGTNDDEVEPAADDEGEAKPDDSTDDNSSDPEEGPAETKDDVQPTAYKVKANGVDFEFTTEELLQMAPKAIDYTKKMQEIAPWRKTISALKEAELGHDDINTMIDVLKGDKAAIATVLERTGVSTLDLDAEDKVDYKPNNYGMNETELAIEDVVSTISMDQEYQITKHVVDNQWDDRSRSKLVENPDMIAGLHADIKSGVYDNVSPIAMKRKVLDGARKSDIEYYMEAGSIYYGQLQAQEAQKMQAQQQAHEAKLKAESDKIALEAAKAEKVKRDAAAKAASKKKAAAPTKNRSGKQDVVDYLDTDAMTDEEFSAFMDKQLK